VVFHPPIASLHPWHPSLLRVPRLAPCLSM